MPPGAPWQLHGDATIWHCSDVSLTKPFQALTIQHCLDPTGGAVQLGAPTDGSVGFVWDNEGPPSPPQQVHMYLPQAEMDTLCM